MPGLWARRSAVVTGGPIVASNDRDVVAGLARQHLTAEDADTWLRLLRPGIQLVPAQGEDLVVARLGGRAALPAGTPWPVWDGHGPLTFIGEIYLDQLATLGLDLDIELPREGVLALFYWDGSIDLGDAIVGTWDRETLAGVRLLHLTQPREELVPTDTPGDPHYTYLERLLTGVPIMTDPVTRHPAVRDAFDPDHLLENSAWWDHPVHSYAFTEALWKHRRGPRHQIGGWATAAQGPVEYEVAMVALPDGADESSLVEEGAHWHLLIQIDTDDSLGMMWGDGGTLYWMARRDDLAAGRLTNVLFTWQCS